MMTRLAAAYVLGLVSFVLLVDLGLFREIGPFVNKYPALDKLIHFLMYGLLALLANGALVSQGRWSLVPAIATCTFVVMLGSTVEEFSNLLVPHRRWSLGDLAANYLGILCLGVLPFIAWRSRRP